METMNLSELAKHLDGNGACRIVSLTYLSQNGELAIHKLLLNVNRRRCLQVDLAALTVKIRSLSGVAEQACRELIDSISQTLETGRNDGYTKRGYYEAVGKGNVQQSQDGVVYVRGYSMGKTVIEKGTYKAVKSAPKTVEKNKLRKELKNTRIREFRITSENFVWAKANGKTLEINAAKNLSNLPAVTLVQPEPVMA